MRDRSVIPPTTHSFYGFDLEHEMGKRVPVRTKAKLREAANDHMAMLEQNHERVMTYFQDRRVRYAA